jgi:hypothetical protein
MTKIKKCENMEHFSPEKKMKVYQQKHSFIIVTEKNNWEILVNDGELMFTLFEGNYDASLCIIDITSEKFSMSMINQTIYANNVKFFFQDEHLMCRYNHNLFQIYILNDLEKYEEKYPGPYDEAFVDDDQDLPDYVWQIRTLETKPPKAHVKYPSQMKNEFKIFRL